MKRTPDYGEGRIAQSYDPDEMKTWVVSHAYGGPIEVQAIDRAGAMWCARFEYNIDPMNVSSIQLKED
jgi:hypothetical protein